MILIARRVRHLTAVVLGGLVVWAVSGCGNPAVETDKARRAETEASQRLAECQAELAQVRKALDEARRGSAATRQKESDDGAAAAHWKAARLTAQVFLESVNSRNADAANAEGSKDFRDKKGGTKAIEVFANGRFRGEANGYTCGPLTSFEAVPGQDEFLGRGKLQYRGVPRQDSSYSVRVVKEGDKWCVASFSAVER